MMPQVAAAVGLGAFLIACVLAMVYCLWLAAGAEGQAKSDYYIYAGWCACCMALAVLAILSQLGVM